MLSNAQKHRLVHKDDITLNRLASALDILLAINPKMPLTYARAFVEVARNPGKGPTVYGLAMNMAQPVASRVLLEIGPNTRHRDQPDHLVDWTFAAHSLREKEYYLTPKGHTLMRELLRALQPQRV